MNEGRKFVLTQFCIVTFIVLLITNHVTSTDFITLISLTFGMFVAGNVAEKFTKGGTDGQSTDGKG